MIYKNANDLVHSVDCKNREVYVGKCLAIDEVLGLERLGE